MITNKRGHYRDLPHFTPNDSPYFVTFCLFGNYRRPVYDSNRGRFSEYDRWLDTTKEGPHHFRDPRLADVVLRKLNWLKQEVKVMHAFTIMSNHVHFVASLHEQQSLSELMHRVKGGSARECNQLLGTTGTFWQSERYDRVLRWNERGVTIKYVVNNPVKAGIVRHWRDHPWTYLNEEVWPELMD